MGLAVCVHFLKVLPFSRTQVNFCIIFSNNRLMPERCVDDHKTEVVERQELIGCDWRIAGKFKLMTFILPPLQLAPGFCQLARLATIRPGVPQPQQDGGP